MTEQPAAIRFEEVTKRFNTLVAIDRLSLEVQAGELFGFLGPNGAGKTTALKLAAGLVKPSEGRVLIGDWDIQRNPLEAKRLVGFVPDNPYIYESLTGREFLHFCAGLYGMNGRATDGVIELLRTQFAIGDWIDKRAAQYSHGMKQRVVMASALLHQPKVVLIDEPMVGLDPAGVRLAKQALRDFCSRGGTVFLSTHTLSDAEELCDRIGIIHWGRLIACGSVDQIKRDRSRLEDAFLAITGGEGE